MKVKTVLVAGIAALASVVAAPFMSHSTAGATGCTSVPDPYSGNRYQMQNYFTVSFNRTGDTGTVTVTRKGSTPLCNDQAMVFQSFNMGSNWNGGGDTHESFISSFPQTEAYVTAFTFGKNDTSKTVTVKTPAVCKGTQLDVYVGSKEISAITGEHQFEEREIGGKIFQPNGTCEVVKVNVCDAKTGNIITVAETEKAKYEAANSDSCKVKVCDTTTNKIVTVPKVDEQKYEAATSGKCTMVEACVIKSGDTTMKTMTKDEYTKGQTKYSSDSEDCKAAVKETVTETPKATPTTPAPAAQELPHTGPLAAIGGFTGLGALTYAIYSYVISRRSL